MSKKLNFKEKIQFALDMSANERKIDKDKKKVSYDFASYAICEEALLAVLENDNHSGISSQIPMDAKRAFIQKILYTYREGKNLDANVFQNEIADCNKEYFQQNKESYHLYTSLFIDLHYFKFKELKIKDCKICFRGIKQHYDRSSIKRDIEKLELPDPSIFKFKPVVVKVQARSTGEAFEKGIETLTVLALSL